VTLINKILTALGLIVVSGAVGAGATGVEFSPYSQPSANTIYNLLFCDDPELFRPKDGIASSRQISAILDENSDPKAIENIAADVAAESRVRALAYNWLRRHKLSVPTGILLGVVVEVPVDGGLDTLAAYSDGRIRYINHSGKMALFEATPASVQNSADKLLAASKLAIRSIGPWDKARLAPPTGEQVRLTFLVSDGLYFGQTTFKAVSGDAIGGPVLLAAQDLLLNVTQAAK
jgi:hypothetical protein